MALTTTQKQQQLKTRLLRKFHALLSKTANPVQAKEEILLSYDVASSKFLTIDQLNEACDALDKVVNPDVAEMDRLRKRLIACIGGWLKCMGRVSNIDIIKGVACRASGKASFNKIPKEQLNSLYYAFKKKQEDMKSVGMLTKSDLSLLGLAN